MSKSHPIRMLTLGTAAMLGVGVGSAQAEVTGNLGVVSQYIFRGGVESASPAVQGGLDYSHDSGFYAGTWFSTLDYGARNNNEADVYGGFAGSVGEFGYDVGLNYLFYTGDIVAGGPNTTARGPESGDAAEAYVSGSYGNFSLTGLAALQTAFWTAAGDIYVNAAYDQPLPQDFTLSVNAGYYLYAGDTEYDDGTVVATKTEDSAFRDATISLSHPLGASGTEMSLNYTFVGEDRTGAGGDTGDYLQNSFWAGVTHTF